VLIVKEEEKNVPELMLPAQHVEVKAWLQSKNP